MSFDRSVGRFGCSHSEIPEKRDSGRRQDGPPSSLPLQGRAAGETLSAACLASPASSADQQYGSPCVVGDSRSVETFVARRRVPTVRQRWAVVGTTLGVAATIVIAVVAGRSVLQGRTLTESRGRGTSATDFVERENVAPASLTFLFRLPSKHNDPAICRAIDRMRVKQPSGAPQLLHEMRLFGPSFAIKDPKTDETHRAVDLLLDGSIGKRYFQQATLIATPSGVRSRELVRRDTRWQLEREAHAGQILAELGELGVPLSTRIVTETSVQSVQDLVNDAMASFDMGAYEIEWTVVGLAYYLGPQHRRDWSDKFGRSFSFDDAAQELLRRPFIGPGIACRGIHILDSLTVLVRIDADDGLLSPSMRLRVLDFLERQVDHLRRTQESDGTWPPNWYVARQAAEQHRNLTQDEIDQRVVVTGHHLEWLLRFPAEHPLSDAALARAASWLETQLAAAPQSTLAEQYCPYSHAAHVLQILYRPDCKSG